MKKILVSLLIIIHALSVLSQCPSVNVDLNTWNAIINSTDGATDWQVNGGGTSVFQAGNGANSFFVSPENFINITFTGTFRIANDGDDDFVGFVVGHNDLGAGNYTYNLLSYKGTFNGTNARCNTFFGNFNGSNFSNTQQTAVAPSVMTEYVCNNTFPTWVYNTNYNFECIYTTSNTTIIINGDTVVDVDGCFEPGHFGFYNSSQSQVTYSNFQYTPTPDYSFVSNDTLCIGSGDVLDATIFCSSIVNPYSEIRWSFGDGAEELNTTTVQHNYLSAGVYDLELYVVDGLGCADSITKEVYVFNPQLNLGPDLDTCFGNEVTFSTNNTTDIVSYNWSNGETTQSITSSIPDNYELVITDVAGCSATDDVNLIINSLPSASFNLNNACPGVGINFEDNSIGNGGTIINWNWNFGDNIGTGVNSTENYSYTHSGNYDVTLIVVDDEGCTDTLIQTVEIYEQPLSSFNYSNGCLYDTATFVDASIIGGSDNIITWSWDIDGDNTEDYNTQNVDHKYTVAGDYNVTLTVESNNSCSNILTETISIFPVPQVGFSASTACVNGAATQFVNSSTISSGSIILNGWNFGDGGTSTQVSPTHNYQIAASYPVTLAVVSDLGCIDSVTYSIDVLGKPSAAYTQDTTNGCAPLCIAFTDTSYDDIPITNWNWKFENNYGESTEQNPTYCYTTSGDYDVSLVITNAQGCKDTLDKLGLVTIHPLPISDFSLSPTSTDVLNSTIDFTNSSTDAAAWIWNFGDGSEDDFSNYDPSHLYGDTGHFEIQLVVINSYLCSDTSYQYVEILPVDELFVPSAFSPNGDGKNDVLYARGYIGVMYFAVFDRLGKKVFESEDKETGWDGLINGKKALAGVYTWYLQAEVNGAAYKLKGDVTLVR